MEVPIFINWTSPFPILGLLGGIFHFYSNFNRTFCKQTVETLIRHCYTASDQFCTVCRCPIKRTLGLNGLIFWDAGQVAMLRYFKALENNMGQYTRLWYLTLTC